MKFTRRKVIFTIIIYIMILLFIVPIFTKGRKYKSYRNKLNDNQEYFESIAEDFYQQSTIRVLYRFSFIRTEFMFSNLRFRILNYPETESEQENVWIKLEKNKKYKNKILLKDFLKNESDLTVSEFFKWANFLESQRLYMLYKDDGDGVVQIGFFRWPNTVENGLIYIPRGNEISLYRFIPDLPYGMLEFKKITDRWYYYAEK
jgi:hypothetical protein